MPDRLRELVQERLAALPPATRAALAAAAALSQPTLAVVAEASDGAEALRAAFDARVIEARGERLHFTHPLLASAAYDDVDPFGRRALHRRLATLAGDEEERARHLALAAEGPDEAVAAALERAAGQAARAWRDRGGGGAAGAGVPASRRPRSRTPGTGAGSPRRGCASPPATPRALAPCSRGRWRRCHPAPGAPRL